MPLSLGTGHSPDPPLPHAPPSAPSQLSTAPHPTPLPQEAGCAALRNLASKLGPTDKGAALTGIRAVVTAMRAHPSVVGVQEAALGALRNFALLTEVREAVDEARGRTDTSLTPRSTLGAHAREYRTPPAFRLRCRPGEEGSQLTRSSLDDSPTTHHTGDRGGRCGAASARRERRRAGAGPPRAREPHMCATASDGKKTLFSVLLPSSAPVPLLHLDS